MDAEQLGSVAGVIGGTIGGPPGTLIGIATGWVIAHLPGVQATIDGVSGSFATDAVKKGIDVARRGRGADEPPEFGADLRGAFHEALQQAIYDIGGVPCFPEQWARNQRDHVPQTAQYFGTAAGDASEREMVRGALDRLRIDAEHGRIFPVESSIAEQNAAILIFQQSRTPQTLGEAFYEHSVAPKLEAYDSPVRLRSWLRRMLLDRTLVNLRPALAARPVAMHEFNRLLLEALAAQIGEVAGTQQAILARLNAIGAMPDLDTLLTTMIARLGEVQKAKDEKLDTIFDRITGQYADIQKRLDEIDRKLGHIAEQSQPRHEAAILRDALQLLASMPTTKHVQVQTLPPRSRMPFSPNPLFTGREDELRTIATALKGQTTVAIEQMQTAAATGMGGMGKTQLASEFAHRYGRYFAGGVFWLSFADAAAVPAEIASCGGAGALELTPTFGDLPLDDQVRMVLAAWSQLIPRLLVFDNCEDEHLLAQYRPTTGGCRVLVTSRRANWDTSLGVASLPLETLSDAEGIALLRKFRPDLAADDPDVIAIVNELGGLPLALHLAGSVLGDPAYRMTITPAKYLAQIRKPDALEKRWLRNTGIPSPTKHDMDVAKTFAISYDLLEPDDPIDTQALALLARAVYFAPGEPIPQWLLFATLGLPDDDLDAEMSAQDSVKRLVDLGLLERENEDGLRLHRLLGVFVRSRSTDYRVQTKVEETIYRVANQINNTGLPETLFDLQSHLRFVTDRSIGVPNEYGASLANELGFHLSAVGDYGEAYRYYLRALEIREQVLGREHPDTAQSLNNLGHIFRAQGNIMEARQYYEWALDIRERVLGREHPDTARSLNNLGTLLQAQGELAEDLQYYEKALKIQERVLGDEHPDTATSLNNLGYLFRVQSDIPRARQYYVRALNVRESVLGSDHPLTALSLNNLGALLQEENNLLEARTYYEKALDIRKRVLGVEHPDTAQSLSNLGTLLQELDDLTGARQYLDQALEIQERVLGLEHPDTARSLNNLGYLLQFQGDLPGTLQYYERALMIQERKLGDENINTAMILNNIGMLLYSQGHLKDAHSHLVRALAICERRLGFEHLTTQRMRKNLALLDAPLSDAAEQIVDIE